MTTPSSLAPGTWPETPAAHGAAEALATERALVVRRNNVRVIGEGPQTLLFCNGFGCSQHIWRYLSTPLASRYRVVLFDYVGTGESDLGAYDWQTYNTLDRYAQDVVEICQVLGLREVVLIGHSVGATIAMLAASQAPSYFAKCVLLTASPCYLNKPGYYGGLSLEDVNQMLALLDVDQNSWANLFTGLLVAPEHVPSLGEELASYFCNLDSNVARHFARVSFLADNRADVSQLRLPTLLLQCADDAITPTEVSAFWMAHLPQATLMTLPAVGHCPHLSAPLETMGAIEAFLAQPSSNVILAPAQG
ncbi:alpha/beta fold hydrolase [Hymenobacter sp. BT559]|uniref:alpha/beta fold hydrolase n=1 Tax=Hymenobacter sp. BT559 TaxID=2795729 RepID=UPI0018EC3135|nr:alpha/beta hydrolase [Hymenobacter sp. BT559]MBJ6141917.1 alpha/beta hydrolase [Hymenobacter sp. BT559]